MLQKLGYESSGCVGHLTSSLRLFLTSSVFSILCLLFIIMIMVLWTGSGNSVNYHPSAPNCHLCLWPEMDFDEMGYSAT